MTHSVLTVCSPTSPGGAGDCGLGAGVLHTVVDGGERVPGAPAGWPLHELPPAVPPLPFPPRGAV